MIQAAGGKNSPRVRLALGHHACAYCLALTLLSVAPSHFSERTVRAILFLFKFSPFGQASYR